MSGRLDAMERDIAALKEYVAADKKSKAKLASLTADPPVITEGTIEAATVELQVAPGTTFTASKTPPKTQVAHPQTSGLSKK